MKKKITCKLLFVVFANIYCLQIFAQTFSFKSSIEKVATTGFYKIDLSPEILAKTQPSCFDIKIVDNQNKQVPYIKQQDQPVFIDKNFIEFPILKKEKEIDSQTHFTIENSLSKPITNLLLITANMQVNRSVNISGSNNQKDWYSIKENIVLQNYFSNSNTSFVQTIHLPIVNYKYFKITILGKDVLPINIEKAGIYTEDIYKGKYIAITTNPIIKQVDSSNKITYVTINLGEAFVIDKLNIAVDGPKFFKRNANLFAGNNINTTHPYSIEFTNNNTDVLFNGMKEKEILLTINNQDNEPLKITSIKAFQLQQSLVAYLEKGNNYQLFFGDSFAVKPNYDLDFFKDSINTNLPILTTGLIEQITPEKTNISPQKNNKWLLWLALSIVIIALLSFTFKIAKEIKQPK